MNTYEELSRKGLVKLAEDYDTHSDGALHSFAESQEAAGVTYPLITPAEKIFENFEDTKEHFVESCKGKIEDASTFVDRFLNALATSGDTSAYIKTFDSMVDEMIKPD